MKQHCNKENGKRRVMRDASSLERFADKYRHIFNSLTRDEKDLLRLLALELTDADIIEQLHISPELLLIQKKILQKKLAANTQTDYIKYAFVFGLISF